jgi:hypothetical protein
MNAPTRLSKAALGSKFYLCKGMVGFSKTFLFFNMD